MRGKVRMNRKIAGLLIAIFLVILIVCCKCTGEENVKTEVKIVEYFPVTYINSASIMEESVNILSEDELYLTHITGILMRNVRFDADITPYSQYKDGLNSYYVGLHDEKIDLADYAERPTIFFTNLNMIQSMIDRNCERNFLKGRKFNADQKEKFIYSTISFGIEKNKKLINPQLAVKGIGMLAEHDIYKEIQMIIDVNQVLKLVKQNFNADLHLMKITICDVKLYYSAYYSHEKEGGLQYIVSPFWVVRYRDGVQTIAMIFNAVTGTYYDKIEPVLL